MQSIIIRKLGPIKECQMEISDFMAFMGKQASGKSTIAKSIFIFKYIPELLENEFKKSKLQRPASDVKYKDSLEKRLIKSIRVHFLKTFGPTWPMNKSMYLKYQYADEVAIQISLTAFSQNPNYIWIELTPSISSFLSELEEEDESLSQIQGEIRTFFDINEQVVYIPAGRSMLTLLSDQIGVIYSMMDDDQKRDLDYCTQNYLERILKLKSFFTKDISEMISSIAALTDTRINRKLLLQAQKLIEDILQASYQNVNGEERLSLPDGHYVKINFASSGQQEVVWILNVLFYFLLNDRNAYFIIEEPESHLYPDAQKLITEYIALAKSSCNKVLVTTHSPYVLASLNNLLYAGTISDNVDQIALDEIVSSKCWLRWQKFMAYYIDQGTPESCMDDELHQIRHEMIDEASLDINGAFDKIVSLENKKN